MPDLNFAQVQVYPNFDYLWRYNQPPQLRPVIRPVIPALRSRLFWGGLFVHSDESQGDSVSMEEGKMALCISQNPKSVHAPALIETS